jgi:hypothetical protein
MIHVDVRQPNEEQLVIQTSVDGSDWFTHYTLEVAAFNNLQHAKDEAMYTARVFVHGCRFAGAEVRSTAFGYNN